MFYAYTTTDDWLYERSILMLNVGFKEKKMRSCMYCVHLLDRQLFANINLDLCM